LYAYGNDVFEDKSRFNASIFRPNRALGGRAPFDLLNTHYGREEVKTSLVASITAFIPKSRLSRFIVLPEANMPAT
jgi:hypothetical protein